MESFREKGFCLIKNAFTEEEIFDTNLCTSILKVINETWKYYEYSNSNNISRIEYIVNHVPHYKELSNDERILSVLRNIYNEEPILMKDKVNFKTPGGEQFKAHQDITAGWDKYSNHPITCAIMLDDQTEENGCLQVWSSDERITTKLTPNFTDLTDEKKYINILAKAGDMLFFDAYLPHKSQKNNTNKERRIIYFTYNPASDGDNYQKYHDDKLLSNPLDIYKKPGISYRNGQTYDMREHHTS